MAKKKEAANPIKDRARVKDMQDYLKEKNERDYVLFVLGIATGYRAGDLVQLRVRDVKEAIDRGYFIILEGKKVNHKNVKEKNKKPRKVKIIKSLEKVLNKYITGKKDYEYIFKSRKGKNEHIKTKRVTTILKEAAKEFGLKRISAHSLRKTHAYFIYIESDYNLELVQEILGHSTKNDSRKYIGLDRETFDEYTDTLNSLIIT